MNAKELREKSVEELKELQIELLREQFNLRMQKNAGEEVAKGHLVKAARRNNARIKTILAEKQVAKS